MFLALTINFLVTYLDSEVIMKQIKIIVEKHHDGYVAYPIGMKGVIIGEGDTYEAALSDVKSAVLFHVESFGPQVFETEEILETFVAELAFA